MLLYIAKDKNSKPELVAKDVICYDCWTKTEIKEIVSEYISDNHCKLSKQAFNDLVDEVIEDVADWEEELPNRDSIYNTTDDHYSEVVNNEEDEESSDNDEEEEDEEENDE